tara:strand:+ start:418 stop:630 length:213 start_codon:yes stop_codon:yes gene_type:complete
MNTQHGSFSMKFAAWLGGATMGCIKTAVVILIFSLFMGGLGWPYWLAAMIVSAWWGGGRALVQYERSLYF